MNFEIQLSLQAVKILMMMIFRNELNIDPAGHELNKIVKIKNKI